MTRYLAITPAKDEERFLPGLVASVTSQSIRPERWILIDDGSTDATSAIVDEAAAKHAWIEAHHLPVKRRAEGGESVVMRFLPAEVWGRYDYILRLDADLSFGPDMVEQLMFEFGRDSLLGIGGPVLLEPRGSDWKEIRVPRFHTRGAAKLYSRECFAAIGGLDNGLGWDTIDEVHAMMRGFRTRHFRHIRAFHHRPQGCASGAWRGRLVAGRAAYRIGYSMLYLMARAAWTATRSPFIVGSALMILGYVQECLTSPSRPARERTRFVRRQQLRRLFMMESQWR
jgi:glycosyltransferase involved in cell wall biosynthesis